MLRWFVLSATYNCVLYSSASTKVEEAHPRDQLSFLKTARRRLGGGEALANYNNHNHNNNNE